jgi:thiamine transport system substrate-binding protein
MLNKWIRICFYLVVVASSLSACQSSDSTPETTPTSSEPAELTVMTHDSFAVSEEVVQAFQDQYHASVRFLKSGDTGTALNKAILSKDNPLADVFYGVDNTFLSRALREGIYEPYASPVLAEIPVEFKLDPENRALPVDYGDVCVNYDKAYFDEHDLALPNVLEDLTMPEYRDLLVVENPATSSPGLAFMLATIGHFGEDGYLSYWQALSENGMLVVNDWDTAYNKEFSRAGGSRPLVVSYGSSPPFEMIFSDTPLPEPPTGAMVGDGSCFRQIEFVGILAGTTQRDLAEKWVDFMLSTTFQEDIPLQMYVFPVNPAAQLDDTFVNYLQVPENPASLDPDLIAENREKWIQAWTETVLR